MSTEGHRNETGETYIRVTEPLLAFSIRGQQLHTRACVRVETVPSVLCTTDNFVSHVNRGQQGPIGERERESVCKEAKRCKMIGETFSVCEIRRSAWYGAGVNMPLVEQRMTELRGLLC